MGFVAGLLVQTFAVWFGTSVAGLEKLDFWRSLAVAFVSFLVMFVVGILLFPLALVPLVNALYISAVVVVGTAVASKVMLDCEWQQSWTIGAVAAVGAFILGILTG